MLRIGLENVKWWTQYYESFDFGQRLTSRTHTLMSRGSNGEDWVMMQNPATITQIQDWLDTLEHEARSRKERT
jgi:hypothetical protein